MYPIGCYPVPYPFMTRKESSIILPMSKLPEKVHRSQGIRHVVANKLQLTLTILQELKEKRAVPRKLVDRAIGDLKAVMRFVDKTEGS